MKGGAIAKFVNPLGMIGTPMKGGIIANVVCPLGMIGNAEVQITSPHVCALPAHEGGDWGGTVHDVD